MKSLAFAALGSLLLATSAESQTADQAPVPIAPSPLPPLPTHDASSYVEGDWTVPTPEQIKAFWPARAQKDGVEGRVTLDCAIAPNGKLASCDRPVDSPAGYGFGQAAIKAYFKFAHVDPASITGGLVAYSRHKFDVVFANEK